MRCYTVLLLVVGLFLCSRTEAHRPVFSERKATSPDSAIVLSDPHVSQVIYREINRERQQLWLAFDVKAGFNLFVQIGVPALEGLQNFRPVMMVVGPGLPRIESPIDLPESAGAKVFSTDGIEEPRFFHEHFTGTDSWILRGETVNLPKAGRYYAVACGGGEAAGKLWLSVGKKEVFSAADAALFPEWRRRIRAFHKAPPDVLSVVAASFGLFGTADASTNTSGSKDTVASLVESETHLSAFQSALNATDTYQLLEGPGPFTVLAPTDEAFSALSDWDELLEPENKDRLKVLIKGHILPSRVFLSSHQVPSLNASVLIHSKGPVLVDDARVLKANIVAENGLVHVIDRVIGQDRGVDASRKQVLRTIETAISYAVPLFNAGRFESSSFVYRGALLSISEFFGDTLGPQARETIRTAVEKAEEEPGPSAKAWVLRYALDDIYKRLQTPGIRQKKPENDLLIDDFSDRTRSSLIADRWRTATDRIMGGVSEGNLEFAKDDRFDYVRLLGNVSLENNGGFIQAALSLGPEGSWFDAGSYRGVRLWVKGNGQRYYVHLRSRQTILPWQYYSAAFGTSSKWRSVELTFDDFEPQNLQGRIRPGRLSRIAIVAAKKAFQAEVCVGRIEFYK